MTENIASRAMKWLILIEDIVRISTIVTMTAIIFFQVFTRIVLKWSSPALEEAARFVMIWSIFIGAVVTTREDSHITMGGFFTSEKGRLYFDLFSKIVVLIFLCIFVKWSFDFTVHSLQKGMNSIVLGVPMVVVHAAFFVTGILMVVHTLIHLVNRFKQVKAYRKGGDRS